MLLTTSPYDFLALWKSEKVVSSELRSLKQYIHTRRLCTTGQVLRPDAHHCTTKLTFAAVSERLQQQQQQQQSSLRRLRTLVPLPLHSSLLTHPNLLPVKHCVLYSFHVTHSSLSSVLHMEHIHAFIWNSSVLCVNKCPVTSILFCSHAVAACGWNNFSL